MFAFFENLWTYKFNAIDSSYTWNDLTTALRDNQFIKTKESNSCNTNNWKFSVES